MRPNRISFQELVNQNKQQLLNDQKAMDEIDDKIDEKHRKAIKQDSIIN